MRDMRLVCPSLHLVPIKKSFLSVDALAEPLQPVPRSDVPLENEKPVGAVDNVDVDGIDKMNNKTARVEEGAGVDPFASISALDRGATVPSFSGERVALRKKDARQLRLLEKATRALQ